MLAKKGDDYLRIQLTDISETILTQEPPYDTSISNIISGYGFAKLNYEDIENTHALPKVNLNQLFKRDDDVYVFYGLEAPSGFMDSWTGGVILHKIGYVIQE